MRKKMKRPKVPFHRRSPMSAEEFTALIRNRTGEALRTLISAVRSKDAPPAVRASAALRLLDHGHGRPRVQQAQSPARPPIENKVYQTGEEYRRALLDLGLHPLLVSGELVLTEPPGPPPPLPRDPNSSGGSKPET